MIIENEQLTIRLLESGDKEIMARWLSDPRVLEYYEGRNNPQDLQKIEQHFFKSQDEATRCIVEFQGRAIGYIQFYPIEKEERIQYGYETAEKIYGTDQFIGEAAEWNKGIGTQVVLLMKTYLFESLGAERIVMDPQAWNERAIACYEKCGYRKVKLLPKHELHEGEMKDCWLMEVTRLQKEQQK